MLSPIGTYIFTAMTIRQDVSAEEQIENIVKKSMRKIYERRVGTVDWLLAINNASISRHSETFDYCTGMRTL